MFLTAEPKIKNTFLDINKNAKRTIPELNGDIKVASTDLGKNTYEKDKIKVNAGQILNTKTLNTKEYHVIIYADTCIRKKNKGKPIINRYVYFYLI